ncbi:hypothetical protein QQF64_003184 [Cirrhinus molitorella]|uniref:Uncharacterized protein n=1 Tax=Cirrhinus molitorella TaxID=172907 RepID=A0ABR3MJB6_9TELE
MSFKADTKRVVPKKYPLVKSCFYPANAKAKGNVAADSMGCPLALPKPTDGGGSLGLGGYDSRFGCERSRVQIPDEPVCCLQGAVLEKSLSILLVIAQLQGIIGGTAVQASVTSKTNKSGASTRSPGRWASGAMDNASDYGSEDSWFDSWLARSVLFV